MYIYIYLYMCLYMYTLYLSEHTTPCNAQHMLRRGPCDTRCDDSLRRTLRHDLGTRGMSAAKPCAKTLRQDLAPHLATPGLTQGLDSRPFRNTSATKTLRQPCAKIETCGENLESP